MVTPVTDAGDRDRPGGSVEMTGSEKFFARPPESATSTEKEQAKRGFRRCKIRNFPQPLDSFFRRVQFWSNKKRFPGWGNLTGEEGGRV